LKNYQRLPCTIAGARLALVPTIHLDKARTKDKNANLFSIFYWRFAIFYLPFRGIRRFLE